MEMLRRIPGVELIWGLTEQDQEILEAIKQASDDIDEEERLGK